MLGVAGVVVVVVVTVVAEAGAGAGATFADGRDLMSSFLRFWKGASKSTVSATEAKNIDINSFVSSCRNNQESGIMHGIYRQLTILTIMDTKL